MHNLGQLSPLLRPIVLMIVLQSASFGQCVPFSEARDHIGATRCISGKVVRVQQGNGGVHFVDFCEDFRICPFTVVVFPSDLKQVGDIRQLAGRQIEIEGEVKGTTAEPRSCSSESANSAATPRKFPLCPRNTTSSATGTSARESCTRPKQPSNQPTRDSRLRSASRTPARPCHRPTSRPPSHQPFAQLLQRILRATPGHPVVP
jgi:hypothetical protein